MFKRAYLLLTYLDQEGNRFYVTAKDSHHENPFIIPGGAVEDDAEPSTSILDIAAEKLMSDPSASSFTEWLTAIDHKFPHHNLIDFARHKIDETHEDLYYIHDLGALAPDVIEDLRNKLDLSLHANQQDFHIEEDVIKKSDNNTVSYKNQILPYPYNKIFEHAIGRLLPDLTNHVHETPTSCEILSIIDSGHSAGFQYERVIIDVNQEGHRIPYYMASPTGDGDCLFNGFALMFANEVENGSMDDLQHRDGVKDFLKHFKEFHPNFEPPGWNNFKTWLAYYNSPTDVERLLTPVLKRWFVKEFYKENHPDVFKNQIDQETIINVMQRYQNSDADQRQAIVNACADTIMNRACSTVFKNLPVNVITRNKALAVVFLTHLFQNEELDNDLSSQESLALIKTESDTFWQQLCDKYMDELINHPIPSEMVDILNIAQRLQINIAQLSADGQNVQCLSDIHNRPTLYFQIKRSDNDSEHNHWLIYLAARAYACSINNRQLQPNKSDTTIGLNRTAYGFGDIHLAQPEPELQELDHNDAEQSQDATLDSGSNDTDLGIQHNVNMLGMWNLRAIQSWWQTQDDRIGSINIDANKGSFLANYQYNQKKLLINVDQNKLLFKKDDNQLLTNNELHSMAKKAFLMILAAQLGTDDNGNIQLPPGNPPQINPPIFIAPLGNTEQKRVIAHIAKSHGLKILGQDNNLALRQRQEPNESSPSLGI